MNINDYLFYIGYALIYLSFGVVLKLYLDFRTAADYSADKEMLAGNLAIGLRRSGAQLGLAIAMIGVLSGSIASDWQKDFLDTAMYGALSVVLMIVALFINDKIILHGVRNTALLKDNNKAVGFLEFGTLVATGIIAYASISGDDGGVAETLGYFIAGQLTLAVLIFIFDRIFASYDLVVQIEKGNVSVGIYLGGKMIAYALVLQSAIVGTGNGDLIQNVINFLIVAGAGMVILYIFELLVDKFIVTSSKVSDILTNDEIVPAMQLTLAKVGMAAILGMSIL